MAVNTALVTHLKTRRSVGIGFLKDPGPTDAELADILTIATRVPDHGKFAPWRLVVFRGEARRKAGELIAGLAKQIRPELDVAGLEIERNQFLPAPVTVGVLVSPKPNPKAPYEEQLLSAGNVCFNLLHAAYAFGFAGSWTNRWYGTDPRAQQLLGAKGGEHFVGFVHIGTPTTTIEDRDRPALADVVSYFGE